VLNERKIERKRAGPIFFIVILGALRMVSYKLTSALWGLF